MLQDCVRFREVLSKLIIDFDNYLGPDMSVCQLNRS